MVEDDAEATGDAPMTEYQMEIFDFLMNHSWTETLKKYGLSSRRVISVVAMRTALGVPWDEGSSGGALPYLSHDYIARLLHLIEIHSREHRSLRTCDQISLAQTLRVEMVATARRQLWMRGFFTLAAKLPREIQAPSRSWINTLCNSHSIQTATSRSMEGVR